MWFDRCVSVFVRRPCKYTVTISLEWTDKDVGHFVFGKCLSEADLCTSFCVSPNRCGPYKYANEHRVKLANGSVPPINHDSTGRQLLMALHGGLLK